MLKQGSLEKLAGAKKGSEKAKQHWQQRWFVLEEGLLKYYDGQVGVLY